MKMPPSRGSLAAGAGWVWDSTDPAETLAVVVDNNLGAFWAIFD